MPLITPAKIANVNPLVNAPIQFAGYGKQGNGVTGATIPSGGFLAAANTMGTVDPDGKGWGFDFDAPSGMRSTWGYQQSP